MKLTTEENLVLILSQPTPSGQVMQKVQALLFDRSTPIDYDWLLQLANLNQVTPLLYKNLSDLQIFPPEFMQRLLTHYIATIQRNADHLDETLYIVDILRRAGIRSIPLKGSFAAETLFGDIGLYPTSDIDLLIPLDDLNQARASLIAAEYDLSGELSEQDQLAGSYHLRFRKKNTVLELHWNLVRRYFQASSAYWRKDTGETALRGRTVARLSNENYLLYLIFRLFCKAFMPLHHFVLMPALLSQDFDWQKFMASARKLRMRRLAMFTLKLMHDSFGLNIPDVITKTNMLGYDLLKRFVIRSLFRQDIYPHLRMSLFLLLLDSPADIFKALFERIFPAPAEIRLRYNIPGSSLKTLFYYILNPFIMILKKTKRF
ncbi:MAG: nucleotidyltransferase family protein [Nitrospirae bacterium]|nr:nucleotidyltransferase family protein [Nitrospirota bacterium]